MPWFKYVYCKTLHTLCNQWYTSKVCTITQAWCSVYKESAYRVVFPCISYVLQVRHDLYPSRLFRGYRCGITEIPSFTHGLGKNFCRESKVRKISCQNLPIFVTSILWFRRIVPKWDQSAWSFKGQDGIEKLPSAKTCVSKSQDQRENSQECCSIARDQISLVKSTLTFNYSISD